MAIGKWVNWCTGYSVYWSIHLLSWEFLHCATLDYADGWAVSSLLLGFSASAYHSTCLPSYLTDPSYAAWHINGANLTYSATSYCQFFCPANTRWWRHCFWGCLSGCPSFNTFLWLNISLVGGEISLRLVTSIIRVSEKSWKGFQGQRSRSFSLMKLATNI